MTVPLWQIDRDNYRKVGREFELRHVTTPQHLRFTEVFAARNDLTFKIKGATILFMNCMPPNGAQRNRWNSRRIFNSLLESEIP